MKRDAVIDESGDYRYELTRTWDEDKEKIAFILLNPSTADGEEDDDTITTLINRSKNWGYGSIVVVNLYSYRATSPEELKEVPDPVGEKTDEYILKAAEESSKIVCAWGNVVDELEGNREKNVIDLLTDNGYNLYCFEKNKTGQPCHTRGLELGIKPTPYKT